MTLGRQRFLRYNSKKNDAKAGKLKLFFLRKTLRDWKDKSQTRRKPL